MALLNETTNNVAVMKCLPPSSRSSRRCRLLRSQQEQATPITVPRLLSQKTSQQSPPTRIRLSDFIRNVTITTVLILQLAPAQCLLFHSSAKRAAHSMDACCRTAVIEKGTDDFCRAFASLSAMDQHALRMMMGCESGLMSMEKRKPNFIRYGRSAPPSFGNSRRLSDPNFLRFGRSSNAEFGNTFEKKSNGYSPSFLRFGKKAASDPNFLRFGKRAPSPSSSAILGAAAESSAPNFLRFGRAMSMIGSDDLMQERFSREYRKPNFLRFG